MLMIFRTLGASLGVTLISKVFFSGALMLANSISKGYTPSFDAFYQEFTKYNFYFLLLFLVIFIILLRKGYHKFFERREIIE